MVNFKPYEQNQLEALLSSGLARQDPTTAFQIFSGLQGGALQRQAERQAMNQQMMQEAIGGLQQYATTPGVDPAGLDALVGSYQAMNPALAKPKFDSRLDQAASSLGGLVGGQQGGTLDQAAVDSVASYAMEAAKTGTQTLHDARSGYMATLDAMGVTREERDAAFDLYGKVFASNAVNPDAQVDVPVTRAGITPTMTTPGPPEPSTLEQLIGGRPGMMLNAATGGMSTVPQLLIGGANAIGPPRGFGSQIGSQVAGAIKPLLAQAGVQPTASVNPPNQQRLEELLRSLTGSLGSALS